VPPRQPREPHSPAWIFFGIASSSAIKAEEKYARFAVGGFRVVGRQSGGYGQKSRQVLVNAVIGRVGVGIPASDISVRGVRTSFAC
jgi:hypothetical protein